VPDLKAADWQYNRLTKLWHLKWLKNDNIIEEIKIYRCSMGGGERDSANRNTGKKAKPVVSADEANPLDGAAGTAASSGEVLSNASIETVIPAAESADEGSPHTRYNVMPSVQEKKELARRVIERFVSDPELRERIFEDLERMEANYPNTDQYHNAGHMYEFLAYVLRIGEEGELSQDLRAVVRRIIGGAYHDSGNEKLPGPPGKDEGRAARNFMDDLLELEQNPILQSMNAGDRITVVADIMATVFPDRHSSETELASRDYLREIAHELKERLRPLGIHRGDLHEMGAPLLSETGRYNTTHVVGLLAGLMKSAEAEGMRHADLCGSLTETSAFKNHVTNRYEDREKFGIKGLTDPRAYHEGFINFQIGIFHILMHPNDLASRNFCQAMQFAVRDSYEKTLAEKEEESGGDRKTAEQSALASAMLELGSKVRGAMRGFGKGEEAVEIGNSVIIEVGKYSTDKGWNPAIFPGMNASVAGFGREKFERADRKFREILDKHYELLTFFHLMINDGLDVPGMTIAELCTELENRGLSLTDYPGLINPPADMTSETFAAAPESVLNEIFLPGVEFDLEEQWKELNISRKAG
jgi:hypothetical protein